MKSRHKLPLLLIITFLMVFNTLTVINPQTTSDLATSEQSSIVQDGVSPTAGSDLNGLTAILKSIGKLNNADFSIGQSLNMKLDPVIFESVDGIKRLAALIRVFVDQKVDHIQFNVVSVETLRAAQKHPEQYKDLVVKVAGYNARFVDLHKKVQDSIIARTEHEL